MTFRAGSWKVDVRSPWIARDVDRCVEITQPEGTGALHISAARKESDVVDPDLREFASSEIPSGIAVEATAAGNFTGVTAEYVDWNTTAYWKKWWLRSGSLMLYVTYTCRRGDEEIEADDVEQMVSTLATTQS
jgi:hypothetical protein